MINKNHLFRQLRGLAFTGMAALILTAVASCTKDDDTQEVPETKGVPMTIELSFAGNADTKVDYSYIDKSGTGTGKAIHPTWEEGDEIAVLMEGKNSYFMKEKFTLTSGAGTSKGVFYCESSVIPSQSDGTVIKIVYPWFDTYEPEYNFSSQTGDLSSLPGWYMGDGVISGGKVAPSATTKAGSLESTTESATDGITLESQVFILHFQGLDFGTGKSGKIVKSLVLSRHDDHDSELSVGWKYTNLYNAERTRIRGVITVTPKETLKINSSGILDTDIYIDAPYIIYAGTFTITAILSD